MSKKLKLTLLENSIDSLRHCLISYQMAIEGNEMYYKYTMLSLFMYIELSLKYFITNIHPMLIYKDSSSKNKRILKTISIDDSIDILERHYENGYYADEYFKKNLEWLRNISNRAKHHELEIDIDEIKRTVGKILSVFNILYDDGEISVEDMLGDADTQFYRFIIDEYALAELDASRLAEKFEPKTHNEHNSIEGSDALLDCPLCECENMTFVLDEEFSQYLCTYCGNEDRAVRCECCLKTFPESERYDVIEDYHWCCEECIHTSKKSRGCE